MASTPVLTIEDNYRSGLETKVAEQLTRAGIKFEYEAMLVPYQVPARTGKYKADFPITGTNIILEPKGHFGGKALGRFSNMTETSAKQRQKFALLKEQRPDLDIRFVFSRASAPIYKGSKTTHAKWATDHGFRWCEKVVPVAWLDEIKQQQEQQCRPSLKQSASSRPHGASSRTCTRAGTSARLKRKLATATSGSRRRSTTFAKLATRSERT